MTVIPQKACAGIDLEKLARLYSRQFLIKSDNYVSINIEINMIMTDRFFDISCKFLKLSSICIDAIDFKKRLCSQDVYPTLRALTNVLSDLGIEHRALRIDINQFQELGTPVLLHYNKGRKQQFVIATNVSENVITYYNDNLQKETNSIDEFSRHWDGVALYVFEPEKQSVVCRLSEAYAKGRGYLLALLTVILIFLVLCMHVATGWFYGLLFLKLVGLFFSVLLLRHDLGKNSTIERQVCNLSKKVSCDAVLSSAASKLFGLIKMSDIGMVYFLGGFLCLMFSLLTGKTMLVLAVLGVLSFCSFPYLLFSLSYQKFKVKKWCPLCLGVISMLLLEIGMTLMRFSIQGYSASVFIYLIIILFFIWLAVVWERLHTYIKRSLKADENEIRFLVLKRNFSIFRMMLDRQPAQDMMFSAQDICIGKPDVPFVITIAINPFCSPCLGLYEKLLSLLHKRSDVFRLNIRFMSMDEERRNEQISLALIAIYIENSERFIQAFDFWQKEKDFSTFVTKYDISVFSDLAKQTLGNHLFWRHKLNINQTPMIFVNNKHLPEIYTESDLLYFLQYYEL